MAEDSKAKKEPVNETQETSMPDVEQKTAEPTVEEPVLQEEVSQEAEGTELPEEVKERTRREFEKLQTQLREERTRREVLEAAFQSFQQPKQEPEAIVPVYDPETGLLNEQALGEIQKKVIEADQRAKKAEETVQTYQREQENRTAYEAHPELDPNNKKFNKELHVATRRVLLDSMLNPVDYGGKQLSFKEAADLAKGVIDKETIEAAKEEGAKQAIEQLTPKEQAALEAVGSPARRTDLETNLEELRQRTRKGDVAAVVERLQALEGKQE